MYRGKRPSKEKLEELSKTISRREIAELFDVHVNTASNWFGQYGLPQRKSFAEQNHVLLSEKAVEFLDGTMLGDSSIEIFGSSGRVKRPCKYKEYMQWYSEQLDSFGIEQAGKILRKKNNGGYGENVVAYRYSSRKYAELKEYANRFYVDGVIKTVPGDIRITPLSLMLWYIDDGTLAPFSTSSQILLCTDAFPQEDVMFLIDKLQALDFSAKYYKSRNRIRINTSSVQDFLDYIGEPTGIIKECYGYKWNPIFKPRNQSGTHNNNSKFNENEIREIRESTNSVANLANMYKVGKSTIRRIKNREAYATVKDIIHDIEI